MSHTWYGGKFGSFAFIGNSDFSGDIKIVNLKTNEYMYVEGQALLDLVAGHIIREKVSQLEQLTTEEILFGASNALGN